MDLYKIENTSEGDKIKQALWIYLKRNHDFWCFKIPSILENFKNVQQIYFLLVCLSIYSFAINKFQTS